jgi:hypothetical protein
VFTSLSAFATGGATLAIGSVTASSSPITTFTLSGPVQLGSVTSGAQVVFTDAATTAITLTGGSDNASSNISVSGITGAAGVTHAITLGGGNNIISFAAVNNANGTAVHRVTVGNGNNTITDLAITTAVADQFSVGSGTNTLTYQTMAHTASTLTFTAANAASTSALTSALGMRTNDTITFAVAPITTTVTALGAAYANVSAGLAAAQTLTASGIVAFQVTGTTLLDGATARTATYIYENTGNVATSELVLVGQVTNNALHTGTVVGNVLTLTA